MPAPTRERIVALAAKLGRRRQRFSMDELAEAAGVSRATLYRLVGGRRGLEQRLAERQGAPPPPDLRARAVAAGEQILLGDGVHALTMERVAALAGIGAATIYRQFGDRTGLLRAIGESSPGRRAARDLELAESADVHADLARFAATLVRFLRQRGDAFLHMLVAMRENPEIFGMLHARSPARTYKMVAAYLRKQSQAGRLSCGDPDHAASALVGLAIVFGWLAPALRMPSLEPDAAGQYIASLFLSGVAQQSKGST